MHHRARCNRLCRIWHTLRLQFAVSVAFCNLSSRLCWNVQIYLHFNKSLKTSMHYINVEVAFFLGAVWSGSNESQWKIITVSAAMERNDLENRTIAPTVEKGLRKLEYKFAWVLKGNGLHLTMAKALQCTMKHSGIDACNGTQWSTMEHTVTVVCESQAKGARLCVYERLDCDGTFKCTYFYQWLNHASI